MFRVNVGQIRLKRLDGVKEGGVWATHMISKFTPHT